MRARVNYYLIITIVLYRQKGQALSFITRDNWKWARELCKILAEAQQVRLEQCIILYSIQLLYTIIIYTCLVRDVIFVDSAVENS